MWSKDIEDVFNILNSGYKGLTTKEAEKRLILDGENKLPQGKKKKIVDIFINQFKSPIILILIVAAIFAILTNSRADSTFIFIVIVINAFIGTYQEWSSEKSAEKLQNMIKINVRVLRDGAVKEIDSENIVIRRYNRIRIWK